MPIIKTLKNGQWTPCTTIDDLPLATQLSDGLMSSEDKVKLDDVADYIVEQGTNNGWEYRKWNSGLAECWKHTSFSNAQLNAWGSVYNCNVPAIDFPTGLFNSTPEINATAKGGYAGVIGYGGNTAASKYHTQDFMWLRGGSAGTISGELSIYAIGRWK